MQPLEILILSDGRPGHYHLSEGVAAAIGRRRPVEVTRLDIARRSIVPVRVAARALALKVPAASVLRHGYAVDVGALPRSDLVISAGGETTAANAAVARHLAADNIYCGTLKHIPATRFSLIVTSYDRFRDAPRHLVALKPSHIDPDSIAMRRSPRGAANTPQTLGLLIGGDSGLFHFARSDWQALYDLVTACAKQRGVRWIISTSRRTPDSVGDAIAALQVASDGAIADFIDYRTAGPGTLPGLFERVDGVVVTEDSSTMLSEAVCTRRPVVGVFPRKHSFKSDEQEYRAFLLRNGWCRSISLADATPQGLMDAMAQIRPLSANPLDQLADDLAQRLPHLFNPTAAGRT
jgi:mitochondrial fission protein ELM1